MNLKRKNERFLVEEKTSSFHGVKSLRIHAAVWRLSFAVSFLSLRAGSLVVWVGYRGQPKQQ